ncbi:MAG: FAD/NAD(P)-binding protein [Bacteroidota bacterium]
MLDWLIVGGGVHGTHLSLALKARLGWPRERVRVLDPHPTPLALWSHQTANTGMAFLRSSYVHHLGVDPFGLKRFAKAPEAADVARFAPPFRRPAYALFQAYASAVIQTHALDALRVQGRATGLQRRPGGWRVETEHGALDARRVVLAVGGSERPCWPAWAQALRKRGAQIDHLFDLDFCRDAVPELERVTVVGGGISAMQAAVALAQRGPTVLVARHAPRVAQLDADPGWLGPKRMARFRAEACLVRRRAAIDAARHRGSAPSDVMRSFRWAADRHGLERITAEIEAAEVTTAEIEAAEVEAAEVETAVPKAAGRGAQGAIRLTLRHLEPSHIEQPRAGQPRAGRTHPVLRAYARATRAQATCTTDRVVLATGFAAGRPGGAWLDEAVEREGLPVAPCGFPRVTASLAWAPGLYATGPLAELELGPTARNIAGARAAAKRLPAP